MEKITTLYSLYQLAIVSGDIYTSAQLKFIKRSGEATELDKIIRLGTIAEVKKLSSKRSLPSWHKLSLRGSVPFEILFKTRNLNHFGKGKFNRPEEECLLVFKKDQLYIFVFKNPKAQSNSLSDPQYWHNYWPYPSNEEQYPSSPIVKDDRAEERLLRNEQSILDDMSFLKKNLSLLPANNTSPRGCMA